MQHKSQVDLGRKTQSKDVKSMLLKQRGDSGANRPAKRGDVDAKRDLVSRNLRKHAEARPIEH